ncbi:MAG: hypothetical protein MMC23_005158 [Stictis urceolatum]|nr:hypothetical protein [Stictis urceolata]
MLVIGDSLTWGFGSTDGNGFRGPLLGEFIGNTAYFIGSQQKGEMYYNFHEGRPGERLNTTLENAAWALSIRPNVILLHIGSNDIIYSDDIGTAPHRMDMLLRGIWQHCPDATLLVARIGPINNTEFAVRYEQFNDEVTILVEAWKDCGAHIFMLDLTKGLDLTQHFVDSNHPNNEGYKIMARQWYKGILKAYKKGWIEPPVPWKEVEERFYKGKDASVEAEGIANDQQTGEQQSQFEHQDKRERHDE